MAVPYKTDSELRVIARDYAEKRIFTDRNCPSDLLGSVFLVASLGGLSEEIRYLKENHDANDALGLIYEYLSEARPRSVNGYPCFMSLRLLNKGDAVKVGEYIAEYESVQAQFAATSA